MSETHGTIWWNELITRDVASARDYYAQVCGWRFETMQMDGGDGAEYLLAYLGDKVVGGILDMAGHPHFAAVEPGWLTYLAVDDIALAVKQTRKAGGLVLRDAFQVPNVGVIATVRDPSGALAGLIVPAGPA